MENFLDLIDYLKNPLLVWRFQQLFGLKKVNEVQKNSKEGHWVALESRKVPVPLPESVRVPSPPVITKKSFEREYRVNERVRAVRRNLSNEEEEEDVCSSGYSSEGDTDEQEASVLYYKIGSYFWYVLFQLCTGLGDETFLAPVFVFILLNVDGTVGRQVMFVWCQLMYIGQAMKDKVRWPRPAMPPVIQMEIKWALEYGMPSTHAMVGLGIPASFFIFSKEIFPISPYLAAAITVVWCLLVSSSRVYLGMHSLADIFVGLLLASLLLPVLVTISWYMDTFLVVSPLGPLITLPLSLLGIYLYPSPGRWTPARGETTACLGCFVGAQLGFWICYQVGLLGFGGAGGPIAFVLDQWTVGKAIVRSVIGGVLGGLAKSLTKPLWIRLSCRLVGIDHRWYENSRNLFVELFYKFWSYLSLGVSVTFLAPLLFQIIGCERSSFYNELHI